MDPVRVASTRTISWASIILNGCGMNVDPILYGAPYSVYVRAVRLTLEEKAVAYRLVLVDVFAREGVPADHLDRHPFGRIPAFEYRGFRLYEFGAITRYVDEVFAGPALQPSSPEERARHEGALLAFRLPARSWLQEEALGVATCLVIKSEKRSGTAIPHALPAQCRTDHGST